MTILLNPAKIDFSVFRKDTLDKTKLKNAKKRFKSLPHSGDKLITVFKNNIN